MSQTIWNTIVPSTTSGNQLATLLNGFKDAVVSGFCGTSRPSQLQAGGYWVDITNDGIGTWDVNIYDGTQDILLYVIDKNTGFSSIPGSSNTFQILKSSNDTVGPILQLQKERIAGLGQTLLLDDLGSVEFKGTRDDGVRVAQARIRAISGDDVTSSHQGGIIVFEQIDTASAALLEKMRLVDGKLGIGTTTPTESLEVRGNTLNMRVVEDANPVIRKARKKRVSGSGQVLINDVVAQELYQTTDASGASIDAVKIEVKALETQTTSAQGNSWILSTKLNGTNTFTAQITVNNSGVDIPNLLVGGIGVELLSRKGAANGYCPLDSGIKISASYLPSYVDDILEFANLAAFPSVGETGKIYVALDTNLTYRWSGSTYVQVSPSPVLSVNGNIGVVVLVKGDIGLAAVDNTSDATKNSATATLTNKTLTSPVINSPTGLVKADVGLGSVDNTSDATKNSAAATLTNKIVTGADIRTPIRSDVKQDTKTNLTTYALTASNGQFVFATDTKVMYQVKDGVLSSVGGGGGVSLTWKKTGLIAPSSAIVDGFELEDFSQTDTQEIYATVVVPQSYTAGGPITLEGLSFFNASTSGNVLMRADCTLIQAGTTVLGTYANTRTTSNAQVAVNAVASKLTSVGSLDITNSTGTINSVAVAPGDKLRIRLYRDVATETSGAVSDARVILDGIEFKI